MPECKCKPFDECFEFQHESRNIVTCSDTGFSKSKYIYNNESEDYLSKYRIDGCLITDNNEKKCDFLLLNCNKRKAYFIELKGSDMIRAIEQIDNSIDKFKSKLCDFSINARIVVTRFNTINLKNDSRFLRLNKKVNGNLLYKAGVLEEVN